MAVTGSYKQECPSCEAMVLIKDRSLVGKKIDCPQCKYRFAVEAPKGEPEAPPAPAAKAAPPAAAKGKPRPEEAVTAKKPSAAPPGPPVKKKPAPKKTFDADDDDDAVDLEPQKGSSKTVIIGVALSVVAVLLLGVGAYLAFSPSTGDRGRGTAPIARNTNPRTTGTEPTPSGTLVEFTNLLPGDTQAVISLSARELRNSFFGRAAFEAPGAFDEKSLDAKLGLRLADIERVLLTTGPKKDSTFAVVRSSKPIVIDDVKTALALLPGPGSPVQGQDFYVTEASAWSDNLGRLLTQMLLHSRPVEGPPKQQQLAFRLADPQTLVIADLEPMTAFLAVKGQPPHKTKPAAKGKGPAPSPRFLTIDPSLKAVLDNTEGAEGSLISLAFGLEFSRADVKKQLDDLKQLQLPGVEDFFTKFVEGQALGVAVQIKDKAQVTIGLECKDRKLAEGIVNDLRAIGRKLLTEPKMDKAGFFLEFDGMNIGDRTPGVPKLVLGSLVPERTAVWKLEMPTSGKGNVLVEIEKGLRPAMVSLRAATEMASGKSRLHELGAAVKSLVAADKQFPRGTFERPPATERLGQPWPANERVSWMAALLPHLGYSRVRSGLETELSWKAGKNVALGSVMVPAFLDSRMPPPTWDAWVPSSSNPYAATHFVGVAGVGLDAASYKADDAAAARKLGILGYDRVTKVDEIKDGPANTILMVQVPWQYQRPWIAGGGATLMGVPEKDSIKPFVCIEHDGKPGTFAIMGDGSVRFLPATMKDEDFKALCTINGEEKVDLDKETVLIPPPIKPVLKAQ